MAGWLTGYLSMWLFVFVEQLIMLLGLPVFCTRRLVWDLSGISVTLFFTRWPLSQLFVLTFSYQFPRSVHLPLVSQHSWNTLPSKSIVFFLHPDHFSVILLFFFLFFPRTFFPFRFSLPCRFVRETHRWSRKPIQSAFNPCYVLSLRRSNFPYWSAILCVLRSWSNRCVIFWI